MTPWRSDVRAKYVTTLGLFMAANPDLLDRVYSARPASLSEFRGVFVGGITENIPDMHSGVWQREAQVDLVCAIHLTDNAETTDQLEELADTLIDWLAADAQAHVLGNMTEQQPIRSQSVEIAEGAIFVSAIAITCRARIQQGRN